MYYHTMNNKHMYFEVLALIFAAIAVYSCRLGINAVIFLMPTYFIRYSFLGIPTSFLEVMIYTLFLVWLYKEMKSGKRFEKLSVLFKKERVLFYGILLLFSGLFISTAYSSDIRTSLGIVKGWFVDPFLFFLIFVSCIGGDKDIKNALFGWVLSGLAVALVAINYFIAGDVTFDGRLRAFFLSPNHLAMYLAPAFIIILAFLINIPNLRINETKEKIEIGKLGNYRLRITNYELLITILAAISVVLYLTHSFGALLGISAGSACMIVKLFCRKEGLHKNKNFFSIALVLLFFGLVLGLGKLEQIENSSGRSSFHSRAMIWNASREMIKESPLVGIGPGTFQEKYLSISAKFSEPYLEWAVPQPHNIFLAFYLQTGVLGLLGFVAILFWFFMNTKKSVMITALMLYFLIHGLIDTTYWKNDLSVMFWLVLGIACSMKLNLVKKAEMNRSGGDFRLT